ncbi:hypothetical protein V8C40DRAFT_264323 [Trichoderma camerunense]
MPPNIPTAAGIDANEMAGHNDSQTEIHEQNVPSDSHLGSNDQELENSELVVIGQRPAPCTRKRNRVKDEEEDELAMPARYSRIRTSTMPGAENWEAFALSQLAQRDPQVVCDLLDSNRAEIKRQRVKIKSLEAEISQEKKSHEEQRSKLTKKMKALRIQNQNFLLQNREDFGTKKASDDTIKGMWWQLSYKIKNTVSNYFTERPQDETIFVNGIEYHIPPQSKSRDQILAIRDSIKRRQLWNAIFYHIFSGNSRYSLGNIGGPIARLLADLDPANLPMSQYLQMISKVKSALDLDLEREADSGSKSKIEEMIQDTVIHFKDIVADKKLHGFEKDLKLIFSDAWDIYTSMMTSKAIFIIQWRTSDGVNDYHYDPETMELSGIIDPNDAPEHVVGVIESPVLWKVGNGDGENFDSTTVLYKHGIFVWEDENEPSTSIWDIPSS